MGISLWSTIKDGKMIINKETKIKDLLETYPFLKDELIRGFQNLNF